MIIDKLSQLTDDMRVRRRHLLGYYEVEGFEESRRVWLVLGGMEMMFGVSVKVKQ